VIEKNYRLQDIQLSKIPPLPLGPWRTSANSALDLVYSGQVVPWLPALRLGRTDLSSST